MTFDVNAIRAQFPILSRQINGKSLVYLDSAASAQKPNTVLGAMSDFARTSYANVHRGIHTLSNEATSAYENAREATAQFIGAKTEEIVFTKGTTEALNLLAHSLGQGLKAGDEIIISELEHHANIVPWHMLCARSGAKLRWANINDDGSFDMAHFKTLLNSRTKIVSIAHISNVLGTRLPIEEIAALTHEIGAKVIIDGSQGVVHEVVDVNAIDVDFYVFSSHKLYGPTGIGVLYGKSELLNQMPPFLGGGEMIEIVTKDSVTFNEAPFRFEAGTPPIMEAVGLHAAIDWLNTFDRAAIAAHENALLELATSELRKRNRVRILGTTNGKAPILAFAVEGVHPHDISQILDKYGVAIRAGHHCAQPLMTRLGLNSSARASFGIYNTKEEVGVFIEAIDKAIEFLT
ncbi:MAG: cysteine desulfurase / selenocysteine lyase [Hyphomonadaceae bacterium]|nr:MAG: cysteine desulfurase / selenocysteine lyase [Hyphomonadaceae bacterium]KAF0186324.1 MAG: cysteine desulfurase / selenocysteine lyase [Hyphomonadaceae bacterium]